MEKKKTAIPNDLLNTFEKEVALCKTFYKEKKGCNWGKCETCGVIPLLYKLYKNVLLEDSVEIEKVKKEVFTDK